MRSNNGHRRVRKRLRLKYYDYSSVGLYFVTICTKDRGCLFWDGSKKIMQLNDAGRMIDYYWNRMAYKFMNIQLDEFIVMPNHIHGIIALVGADPCVGPELGQCSHPAFNPYVQSDIKNGTINGSCGPTRGSAPTSLFRVMQWFKTMTTNAYIRGVKTQGWESFPDKLWQRNYYERVIRDEEELNTIREYIQNNPAGWDQDAENVSP